MGAHTKDLWSLVRFRPQVDPEDLAEAIQAEVSRGDLDYRTRLLIRDGLEALRQHWPQEKLENWLTSASQRDQLQSIWQEDLGEAGFPSLAERVMDKTDPEDIRQFLRELGSALSGPVRVVIGGSIALI